MGVVRRAIGLVVSALSAAVLIAGALSLRGGEWPIGVLLWVATAWGAMPFAILTLFARGPLPRERSANAGTVTTIIHVGYEPVDVARTSVVAAAAGGPTMIVTTDPGAVAAYGGHDVPVIVAPTIAEALVAAAGSVETDAVLLLPAGCFVDAAAAAGAAGLLGGDVGWVIGRAHPFNRDGYAPTRAERLDQRIRESARARGADLWEPNATLVSTVLLRGATVERGRPWGSWLRAWRDQGYRGATVGATLTVWSVPVTPEWYWRRSVLRRRGLVADLADAAVTRRGGDRGLSIAMLLRELYAFSFGVWLLSPVLLSWAGAFPFRISPSVLLAMVGGSGVLRWATLRWMYGVPIHPLRDLLAAAYDAPSSLLALPAALVRRIAPTRLDLPRRPLVWVTALLALAMVVALVFDRDAPGWDSVAAMALAELALLWLFGMQGVLQLGWLRSTYRVRLTLPVEVDGCSAATVDASSSGIAVRGRFPPMAVGRDVAVAIHLDDGTVLRSCAVVSHRRRRGDDGVVGLTLSVDGPDEARWGAQLARAAVAARGGSPVEAPPTRHRSFPPLGHLLGDALTVLVGGVALVVGAVLVLLVFDYHPMVVRSGSMEPSLGIGDIVLVQHVPASRLEVGDIATFDVADDGGTTHRVMTISEVEGALVVETRGDANDTGEVWSIGAGDDVGVVVRRVPRAGIAVSWLDSTPARPYLVPVALVIAAAVIAWPIVQGRPSRSGGSASHGLAVSSGAVDRHDDESAEEKLFQS